MFPAGIAILDVSDIQQRKAGMPRVRQINRLKWNDGSITQSTLPVTYQGKPSLITVDEGGAQNINGAVRFIDISNERAPTVASHIRLSIQTEQNLPVRRQDLADDSIFSHDAHYCDVVRRTNPTALACAYFNAGIRVFNIANPLKPHEIAYFNPPAQTGRNAELPGSDHAQAFALGSLPGISPATGSLGLKLADLMADWCSSPPRFVNGQLWVSCADNGFMVLKFTNGVYPIP